MLFRHWLILGALATSIVVSAALFYFFVLTEDSPSSTGIQISAPKNIAAATATARVPERGNEATRLQETIRKAGENILRASADSSIQNSPEVMSIREEINKFMAKRQLLEDSQSKMLREVEDRLGQVEAELAAVGRRRQDSFEESWARRNKVSLIQREQELLSQKAELSTKLQKMQNSFRTDAERLALNEQIRAADSRYQAAVRSALAMRSPKDRMLVNQELLAQQALNNLTSRTPSATASNSATPQ